MDSRARVELILGRLGLLTPERVETVLALLDDTTRSPFAVLARIGLPFSAGAGTRQLLDYIAGRLGKSRMDRELRDYIMLPLREVGILRIAYVNSGLGQVIPDYWKPKSPNNVYRLDEDFRGLINLPDDEFSTALDDWEHAKEERLVRILSAQSSAWAAREDERLVYITRHLYCRVFLPDYEVVFVDDKDMERVAAPYKANVERMKIPLDLSTRWPDIILNIPGSNRIWIVDCVETDGEVDVMRRDEMQSAFERNGLNIDGFTTVYRTARRFAERQSRMDNIAPDTYVWIAETGGGQYFKQAST